MAGETPRRRRRRSRRRASARPSPEQIEARESAAAELGDIRFPPDLPVSGRAGELIEAIRTHPVLIVAGETGSGKSTQLPKLALAAGRGRQGLIGHTQPRRIAARAVAERVADELGVEVGGQVGYAVRFTDEVGPSTLVKVMTDGILLAEIQRDRWLERYDTVIVDEAHERSLNIDFLLGYLHRLRERRPDLRVIVTSATIDTERFAAHFADADGEPAPVIEVSGRTYPVEIRYRPLGEDTDDTDQDGDGSDGGNAPAAPREQAEGVAETVRELAREGPGDVLVFCSGEREIRDAAEAVAGLELPSTEVLPLYARLSAAEQHKIFSPHRGRRVVIATNIAETSLTVPGIRYVIDTGTARISRFSNRTKVQRLPIEPISQASADQRAGRAGRLGPGIAVRLYAEDDFENRPEFTEPEILRTGLASVILRMAALGLGDVADFPFLDPPDRRSVRAGLTLLAELGAVDPAREGERDWLTDVGRTMARLPVDPRLARAIVAAGDLGCVSEVLIIAAALSIQDPRERPAEKRQAADEYHARFHHPDSDLLAYLALWRYLSETRRELSSSAFRRRVRKEYLHYLRIREWQDVERQLRQVASQAGLRRTSRPADADDVHRALLAGFATQVGTKGSNDREYKGLRNARFVPAPDSVFFKRSPRWIMAAELIETSRLWARGVARIQPEWIEEMAPHLLETEHLDPWWDPTRGSVMTTERIKLGNLTVIADRAAPYDRIDAEWSRRWFVQTALVEGDWEAPHGFLAHNAAVRAEAAELVARTRRRDRVRSDAELAAWFDERIPDDIASGVAFDRWWRKKRTKDRSLLELRLEDVVVGSPALDAADFPETWQVGDLELEVAYEFDATTATDGVVVEVPLELAARLDPDWFTWQVPGRRAELVEALLRTLPKPVRREFVPLGDTVDALLPDLDPTAGPLAAVLADVAGRRIGVRLTADDFDVDRLPAHLLPTFQLHDADGVVLAEGTDLDALRARLADRIRATVVREARREVRERTGLLEWPGEVPAVVRTETAAGPVEAHPALVDEGHTVGVRVLADADRAEELHRAGVRRLLRILLPVPARSVRDLLTTSFRLALAVGPYDSAADWVADACDAVLDELLRAHEPVRDADAWAELFAEARRVLPERTREAAAHTARVLEDAAAVRAGLDDRAVPAGLAQDLGAQLERLVFPGFALAAGERRLPDLARYLDGMRYRLERPAAFERDRTKLGDVLALEQRYDRLVASSWNDELERLGWSLEELRIGLLAQPVGTGEKVSVRRIDDRLRALERAG